MPAGWLHEVHAEAPSATVSLTTLPREHAEFNRWMTAGLAAVLPFTARGGAWDTPRLAAALSAFVPELLERLGYGAPGVPDPLEVFVRASYGEETRSEMGMPGPLPRYPRCGKPSAEDRRAAKAAAREVAERFASFRADLRGLYLGPYLENALSKVAGAERDVAKIMAVAAGFAETCLLGGTRSPPKDREAEARRKVRVRSISQAMICVLFLFNFRMDSSSPQISAILFGRSPQSFRKTSTRTMQKGVGSSRNSRGPRPRRPEVGPGAGRGGGAGRAGGRRARSGGGARRPALLARGALSGARAYGWEEGGPTGVGIRRRPSKLEREASASDRVLI